MKDIQIAAAVEGTVSNQDINAEKEKIAIEGEANVSTDVNGASNSINIISPSGVKKESRLVKIIAPPEREVIREMLNIYDYIDDFLYDDDLYFDDDDFDYETFLQPAFIKDLVPQRYSYLWIA